MALNKWEVGEKCSFMKTEFARTPSSTLFAHFVFSRSFLYECRYMKVYFRTSLSYILGLSEADLGHFGPILSF